jgi:hypothetical protein
MLNLYRSTTASSTVWYKVGATWQQCCGWHHVNNNNCSGLAAVASNKHGTTNFWVASLHARITASNLPVPDMRLAAGFAAVRTTRYTASSDSTHLVLGALAILLLSMLHNRHTQSA